MKKEYRIKKSKEIEEVLKNKKYASNPYFSIYIKENNENHHFRYAISVNKKIGKAVVRNKIKRQVREMITDIFDFGGGVMVATESGNFHEVPQYRCDMIRACKPQRDRVKEELL